MSVNTGCTKLPGDEEFNAFGFRLPATLNFQDYLDDMVIKLDERIAHLYSAYVDVKSRPSKFVAVCKRITNMYDLACHLVKLPSGEGEIQWSFTLPPKMHVLRYAPKLAMLQKWLVATMLGRCKCIMERAV